MAAAAVAEMRQVSAPVASGSAAPSSGTQEDASVSPLAITQLERSLDAWRTLLGAGLLLAAHALAKQDRLDDVDRLIDEIVARLAERFGDQREADLGPAIFGCAEAPGALGE